MGATANPIQGGNNMIKRLNKYVLSKILGIRLRPSIATLLGGSAGLSLTTTILPTVIEILGVTDSFSARLDVAGFAVYSVLAWAVGGWAAQRVASTLKGGIILASVGAVSSAIFALLAYGPGVELLLTCASAGLAYGSIGGMLIAASLVEPAAPKSASKR